MIACRCAYTHVCLDACTCAYTYKKHGHACDARCGWPARWTFQLLLCGLKRDRAPRGQSVDAGRLRRRQKASECHRASSPPAASPQLSPGHAAREHGPPPRAPGGERQPLCRPVVAGASRMWPRRSPMGQRGWGIHDGVVRPGGLARRMRGAGAKAGSAAQPSS